MGLKLREETGRRPALVGPQASGQPRQLNSTLGESFAQREPRVSAGSDGQATHHARSFISPLAPPTRLSTAPS